MSLFILFGQSAFQLLQDHCQVDADRIGVIGLSFGVCLTFRIATRIGVKVRPKLTCFEICRMIITLFAYEKYKSDRQAIMNDVNVYLFPFPAIMFDLY